MKRRQFIKATAAVSALALLPKGLRAAKLAGKVRTAHIGVGGMGMADLKSISSHADVDVAFLCDVDSSNLAAAQEMFPKAKIYKDYRKMLAEVADEIDAVIVSTPDHTHAPASMMAMKLDKPVYCQKPLTHHVTEARAMRKLAEEKKLVTQMGIQIHSWNEYRGTAQLIQSGIIGKVKCVRAWSNKNWGYDGEIPTGSDPVPANLDWNLWLGTSPEREYKEKVYHPGNWRKLLDYGCGTLGDMGVHIFDTPYTALNLDVPKTIKTSCRETNGFSHPEHNIVTYQFPATEYTTKKFKWIWYDGPGAPELHKELEMPNGDKLPDQGAMFIGEKGRILLPHINTPKHIVDGAYVDIDFPELEKANHYHQFVDACLGKAETSAPFSYASRLTEAILLGVIANRFPNKTLHWNNETQRFKEPEANALLDVPYREF
ncbi:Predicted dehydrogenase [Spirosomataceae bacterium TFI 002]|nr:Predicted dehydrogenase [Spirosomataceae bacterium TFI 002]